MYLFIITSVINTPIKPLNYCNLRSIFNKEERFEQTKNTIESINKYIPEASILIVECSYLNIEEEKYLKKNSNYFINLYDNIEIRNKVYGLSKSLGEGTMTIEALKFIKNNNIIFDKLIKLSGRYKLNSDFNKQLLENNYIIVKKINNDKNNILTAFYKIQYCNYINLLNFLIDNITMMNNGIGYELIFAIFINKYISEVIFIDKIGIEGKVSVCGSLYKG